MYLFTSIFAGLVSGYSLGAIAFLLLFFALAIHFTEPSKKAKKPVSSVGKTYTIKSNPNEPFFEKIPDGSFCYTFINNSNYIIKDIQFYYYDNNEEITVLTEPLNCNSQIDIVSPFGKYGMEFLVIDSKTNTTTKLNSTEYKNQFNSKFGQIVITNDGILVTDN